MGERMQYHPNVVLRFSGKRGDAAALKDLEEQWPDVTDFVKQLSGSGAELLSENGRANKTLKWYKKKGFIMLDERSHREFLARHCKFPEEKQLFLLLDAQSDHQWQSARMRKIWDVSKVLKDTCPMFLPLS